MFTFSLSDREGQCEGHFNLEGLYLMSFLVCKTLPFFIPTACVTQSAKALGPLVRLFSTFPFFSAFQQPCITKMAGHKAKRTQI